MAAGDLTSLANVKSWAGVTSDIDDVSLSRLITAASRFIINYIQRGQLVRHTVNELRRGTGNDNIMLREYPVIQINSLIIRNSAQTPQTAPPFGSGYVLEPWDGTDTSGAQKLFSCGCLFWRDGLPTVSISYDAGFYTSEIQTISADGPFTLTTNKVWAADGAVVYTNTETPLVAVASQTPAQGQYNDTGGLYTFNAADASASVTLSYSYTPADIEQACIELVGERYKASSRIGMVSKTLGGQETVTFSQKDMNSFIMTLLQPFVANTPISS
jgi:hypothetical protein